MPINKIIPQMFDVRPVDETGNLDWKKIHSVSRNGLKRNIKQEIHDQKVLERNFEREAFIKAEQERIRQEQIRQFEKKLRLKEELRIKEENEKIAREELEQRLAYEAAVVAEQERIRQEKLEWERAEKEKEAWLAEELARKKDKKAIDEEIRIVDTEKYFFWKDLFAASKFAFQFNARRTFLSFAIIVLSIYLSLGGVFYASKSFSAKGEVLGATQDGFSNLTAAIKSMADRFCGFEEQFSLALANFSKASEQLSELGGLLWMSHIKFFC